MKNCRQGKLRSRCCGQSAAGTSAPQASRRLKVENDSLSRVCKVPNRPRTSRLSSSRVQDRRRHPAKSFVFCIRSFPGGCLLCRDSQGLDSKNAPGVMISAHESLEATLSLLVRRSLSRGSARIFASALALFACARFHLFFGVLLPRISNSRPTRSQRNSSCRRISQGRSKFSRSFALLVCAYSSLAR